MNNSATPDPVVNGCTICGKPTVGRGWCRVHYNRWHRHGDPFRESARSVEAAEWFWSKVDCRGDDECWPWTASRSKHGYGWFKFDGRMTRAHRIAWLLTHGSLPEGVVRHACDNPPCCNPAHLLSGTQADNVRDREERNRRQAPKGEEISFAKLTEHAVKQIRHAHPSRDGLSWAEIRAIANEYNVSPFTIRDVIDKRSWRHVA